MFLGGVYKGLEIATGGKAGTTVGTFLYVTNFRTGEVEMYDTSFTRVNRGAFADPNLPRGYAPFNIVHIGDKLVVTYALQDAEKHDDVAGMSHGIGRDELKARTRRANARETAHVSRRRCSRLQS